MLFVYRVPGILYSVHIIIYILFLVHSVHVIRRWGCLYIYCKWYDVTCYFIDLVSGTYCTVCMLFYRSDFWYVYMIFSRSGSWCTNWTYTWYFLHLVLGHTVQCTFYFVDQVPGTYILYTVQYICHIIDLVLVTYCTVYLLFYRFGFLYIPYKQVSEKKSTRMMGEPRYI